jgi:hypothetical protein
MPPCWLSPMASATCPTPRDLQVALVCCVFDHGEVRVPELRLFVVDGLCKLNSLCNKWMSIQRGGRSDEMVFRLALFVIGINKRQMRVVDKNPRFGSKNEQFEETHPLCRCGSG